VHYKYHNYVLSKVTIYVYNLYFYKFTILPSHLLSSLLYAFKCCGDIYNNTIRMVRAGSAIVD